MARSEIVRALRNIIDDARFVADHDGHGCSDDYRLDLEIVEQWLSDLEAQVEPAGPHIRLLPPPENGERVETGAIQFGRDWPGLFVRGDRCADIEMELRRIASMAWLGSPSDTYLLGLADLFRMAIVGPKARHADNEGRV